MAPEGSKHKRQQGPTKNESFLKRANISWRDARSAPRYIIVPDTPSCLKEQELYVDIRATESALLGWNGAPPTLESTFALRCAARSYRIKCGNVMDLMGLHSFWTIFRVLRKNPNQLKDMIIV